MSARPAQPPEQDRPTLRRRLLSALQLQDEEAFDELISIGAPWTGCGAEDYGHQRTPLMWAALAEWPHAIEALVASGSPIDEPSRSGGTPLLLAFDHSTLAIAELLLNLGASMDVADGSGETVLHKAASCLGSDRVDFLLARGFSNDALDLHGNSALAIAASDDNVEAVKALAKAGFALDKRCGSGRSALMAAIDNGSVDAAMALLALGADPRHEDDEGRTPLISAVDYGQADILGWLMDAGVDPRRVTRGGLCALSLEDAWPGTMLMARERAAMLDSRDAIETASRPSAAPETPAPKPRPSL